MQELSAPAYDNRIAALFIGALTLPGHYDPTNQSSRTGDDRSKCIASRLDGSKGARHLGSPRGKCVRKNNLDEQRALTLMFVPQNGPKATRATMRQLRMAPCFLLRPRFFCRLVPRPSVASLEEDA